jgi:hypothetical protein
MQRIDRIRCQNRAGQDERPMLTDRRRIRIPAAKPASPHRLHLSARHIGAATLDSPGQSS